MNRAIKKSTINSKKYFCISQNIQYAMQKNITVEDNKKRMNIANFTNIYTDIYTYIICDEND